MVRSAGAEEARRGGAQRFFFWFGLAQTQSSRYQPPQRCGVLAAMGLKSRMKASCSTVMYQAPSHRAGGRQK